MLKRIDKIILIILLIVSTISILSKINNTPILEDEIYELLRANNTTSLQRSEFALAKNKKVHKAAELISRMELQGKRIFTEDSQFYLENFNKLTNHAPINGVISKIPILAQQSIFKLRLLSFLFWLSSILLLYLIQAKLSIHRDARLIAIVSYISFTHSHSIASYAKAYALTILFVLLAFLFFVQLLQSKSQWQIFINWLLFIDFAHLAFLTYYLSIAYICALCIALVLFRPSDENNSKTWRQSLIERINLKRIYISLITLILSHAIYLPYAKSSLKLSHDSFVSGAYPFYLELIQLFKKALYITCFNYKIFIALPIAVLLFYFYRQSQDKEQIKLFAALSLAPFIAIICIDYLTNKHLIMVIRYFYVSLPFVAIMLALIATKEKALRYFLLAALLINIAFPQLQRYTKPSIVFNQIIEEAQKLETHDFNKKTMVIMRKFNADYFIFLKYLASKLINKDPIKDQLEKSELEKVPQIANLFLTTSRIPLEKLLLEVKTHGIEKIIIYKGRKNFKLDIQKLEAELSKLPDLELQFIQI